VQRFYYDSDATGGVNSVSTMDTRACAAPTVILRNGYAVLECDTTTDVR